MTWGGSGERCGDSRGGDNPASAPRLRPRHRGVAARSRLSCDRVCPSPGACPHPIHVGWGLLFSCLFWLGVVGGGRGGGGKSVLDSDRRDGEGLLPEVMGEEACTPKGPPRAQPALAPSLMRGCPKAQPGPRLCGKRESRCRKAKLSVLRQVCSPPRFVMASSTLTCL